MTFEILGQAKPGGDPGAPQETGFTPRVYGGRGKHHGDEMLAGEVVPLRKPVVVNEAVEVWLADLAANMVQSLSGMLVRCLAEKDTGLPRILSLADQVHFSQCCWRQPSRGEPCQISWTSSRVSFRSTLFDVEGMRVMQLKVQSLVMDLIHSIDVVEQLQKEYCSNVGEVWQRQLRYYGEGRGGGVQAEEWTTARSRTVSRPGHAKARVHPADR